MFSWGILIPLAPFIMVVLIVWLQSRSKLEEKRMKMAADQSAEKAAQYVSRMTELEDRVRVLERIVTDKGYDVATQIEALRDVRNVEDSGSGVPLEFTKKENV